LGREGIDATAAAILLHEIAEAEAKLRSIGELGRGASDGLG